MLRREEVVLLCPRPINDVTHVEFNLVELHGPGISCLCSRLWLTWYKKTFWLSFKCSPCRRVYTSEESMRTADRHSDPQSSLPESHTPSLTPRQGSSDSGEHMNSSCDHEAALLHPLSSNYVILVIICLGANHVWMPVPATDSMGELQIIQD